MRASFLRDLLLATWAVPAFVANTRASTSARYTVKHRLTFRPGDERAAVMLRATPARRLVRGPFVLAMVDLDGDGEPELVVQKLPRSGGATSRSTMVLKRFDGGYGAIYQSRLADRLAITNEKIGNYHGLAELDAGGGIRFDKNPGAATFGRQVVHVPQ